MDRQKPPGIRIGQIFLARSLFEHTVNPSETDPKTPIGQLQTKVEINAGIDEEEKVGYVAVAVMTTDDSPGLYRFHVEMVAIVDREPGAENISIREYVRHAGPAMLYPFIRETVATITGKGRFGPLWLPPFNFAAMAEDIRFPDETEAKAPDAHK